MSPGLFAGTTAEDEYYLPRHLSRDEYVGRMTMHRKEYITERDFAAMKLLVDVAAEPENRGRASWDFQRSIDEGWFPEHV